MLEKKMLTNKTIEEALKLPGEELFPRLFKARASGKMSSEDVNALVRIWCRSKSPKPLEDLAAYAKEIGI